MLYRIAFALWCRRSICFWTASASLLSVRLAALYQFLGLCELGQVSLFYDFAPWRRLLIRDNQLTVGILVTVIFLGVALCNHSETKKVETKCMIQNRNSPRVSDPLVYFSMVSFNVCGETGFSK